MKLKKTVAIAAAASALAAVSVPAMAFENEFHGTSRLRYFLSNYENANKGGVLLPLTSGAIRGPNTSDTTENLKMNNYFEQRTRIFYTAKASDDLKLVTGFEIDSVFGDKAQGATTAAGSTVNGSTVVGTGRNQGGALESDTVNLETKWVYLDFKIPSTPVQVKAGIQPIKDQLKGVFFDADIAGILTTSKIGAATVNAGYFRGYDQSFFGTNRPYGMDNLNLGLLEGKFALSKDLNVGAVYYLYDDSRGSVTGVADANGTNTNLGNDFQVHVFGVNGDAKLGKLSLSGFAAYQYGIIKQSNANSAHLNAYAANVAAKAPIGPGTLRTALLVTSGNGQSDTPANGHLKGWVSIDQNQNNSWAGNASAVNTYNESGMLLLNRNAAASTGTTDTSIVYNTGNGTNPLNAQGVYLATVGYDLNITPKFYTNFNAGAAWAAHTNSLKPVDKATTMQNATNYMATEINLETGYKMYDNLTASLQAAYVFLGGYYKNSSFYGTQASPKDPENPYTIRTSLIYNF
ncbi:hypothetical protein [Geobacter sp. SVR]|uniref:hypothetical protein n=1 Tax=Geobacter sp. SVR TaxID=2495594 RepID=UPI00143EF729|nr:hypothetical protein [Geobacter sp. SVR]BCS55667.1 histidine kinase [Geobacter sp. SVR]GCF83671.1 histidine kinase [Geobacter sp. SVR]